MKTVKRLNSDWKSKMPLIRFKTKLFKIKSWTILQLPENESVKLPSRGQTMVEGTINGCHVRVPLEPDGKWSHWLKVDEAMQENIGAQAGDSIEVAFDPIKEWPEPNVPKDIENALKNNLKAHDLWKKITPMARWEWIRWIRATNSEETRAHRVEVAMSKLKSGERRPCCWNRAACSEPYVSKGGRLLEPVSD